MVKMVLWWEIIPIKSPRSDIHEGLTVCFGHD